MIKGKRIFIVEDDPSNMAIMAVSLRQEGAIVIQDPWNSDTINRIQAMLPVDIILLDLMLRRGVSGYDIYAQITAQPDLAKSPVVVVSASDPSLEMPRARNLGMAGYITKPIRLRSFVDSVTAVMQGQAIWASDPL